MLGDVGINGLAVLLKLDRAIRGEKIDYLVKHQYYEPEVFEKYSFDFVKSLSKLAYSKKFRFPTFLGACTRASPPDHGRRRCSG